MGIENPVHLLFIGAVALLVLGPKRLPELARALGKGMREFRQAMSGEGEEKTETETDTDTETEKMKKTEMEKAEMEKTEVEKAEARGGG
jgi:TatA/E family protein of Tat protein translocase